MKCMFRDWNCILSHISFRQCWNTIWAKWSSELPSWWMSGIETYSACTITENRMWLPMSWTNCQIYKNPQNTVFIRVVAGDQLRKMELVQHIWNTPCGLDSVATLEIDIINEYAFIDGLDYGRHFCAQSLMCMYILEKKITHWSCACITPKLSELHLKAVILQEVAHLEIKVQSPVSCDTIQYQGFIFF